MGVGWESPLSDTGPRSAAEMRGEEGLHCEHAVVIPVRGEIDMANAAVLEARLLDAMQRESGACVIADLSGVAFIDASGLRALVGAKRASLRAGRHFVLAEPSPQAIRLLDALKMSEVLDIYPMVDMALAHVAGPGRLIGEQPGPA